jgi:hypothetical protein
MALLLSAAAPAGAYSVLSHESAIDEAWDRELRPLLLAFKAPTAEVDWLFEDTIARAHARFREMVRRVRDGRLDLSNTNFDTGEPTHANDYALADTTYAEWLDALAKREFTGASPAVRRTIDAYYRDA